MSRATAGSGYQQQEIGTVIDSPPYLLVLFLSERSSERVANLPSGLFLFREWPIVHINLRWTTWPESQYCFVLLQHAPCHRGVLFGCPESSTEQKFDIENVAA